jgi:hypothetical protein
VQPQAYSRTPWQRVCTRCVPVALRASFRSWGLAPHRLDLQTSKDEGAGHGTN